MKRIVVPIAASLILAGCVTDNPQGLEGTDWVRATENVINQGLFGTSPTSTLTIPEITAGLRDALRVGTGTVVNQLGQKNGFNLDPKIHIPLPENLQKVDSALKTIGMNGLTKDLETRLNRAAEAATPRAKELFLTAIRNMTIEDARNILNGPNDAATAYLRRAMGPQLANDIRPIVQNTLAEAGAIRAYDQALGQYAQIPFMPDVKTNLNNYVTEKALDGIFYYVAKEEAAIRANPAKRTTEILRKVFGQS